MRRKIQRRLKMLHQQEKNLLKKLKQFLTLKEYTNQPAYFVTDDKTSQKRYVDDNGDVVKNSFKQINDHLTVFDMSLTNNSWFLFVLILI